MKEMRISRSVTLRDVRSMENYLKDIAKEPRLSPEEEVELSKRIQQGDKTAVEALVRGNLRFVISAAKNYQGQGVPLSDLISAGNIGLINAASRFDASRGFKFCTYAVWWIRQSILQAIDHEGNVVNLPSNQTVLLNKARRVVLSLEQQLQRKPTNEEIEEAIGDKKVLLEWLPSGAKNNSSFDMPVSDDGDATAADYLVDEDAPHPDDCLVNESLHQLLHEAICRLKPIEREAVGLYYGIGHTRAYSMEEISMRLGVSRERVRQLVKHGLQCLREGPYTRLLMAEVC